MLCLSSGLIVGNNDFIVVRKLRQDRQDLLFNIFFALVGGKCNGNHGYPP